MSSEWDSRPGDFFRFVEEYKSLSGTAQQAKWQGLNDQQRDYLKTTYGLQAPSAKKKRNYKPWGCAAWIVLFIFGLVWLFSLETPEDDTVGALSLCRRAVERKLVSPASAEHPWVSSKDVTSDLPSSPRGDNRYRVRSYVDSQNRMGAMLRTEYDCVVERSGETLKVISLLTK